MTTKNKEKQDKKKDEKKEIDYEKEGLKVGLEIHQQLNTKKLFCNCPSKIRDDKPDIIIKRRLKASAGETGTIDKAAAAEAEKEKYYLYEAYEDTTCLVELDEEPPHPMNKEALKTCLQVCKIIGANIVDEIRVMRKTVIDGSNTTGFQRTALIGTGGTIEGVRIQTICLEEDAAKIVKKEKDHTKYNLSRLGIPLIEIATEPDIKSPEQAKETAEAIGLLLRSTGKVKRGLGSIRQDLNISIKEGVRVEIKGVQELRLIPEYVKQEVIRQKNMIKIINELKERKASVKEEIKDLTEIFKQTKARIIEQAIKNKGAVLGIKLEKYSGMLGKEIQTNRRLGTEFSDHAKTAGVKGLFHSDEELTKYGITEEEIKQVKEKLGINKEDAFIIIAEEKRKAEKALKKVIQKAKTLRLEKEVRQARPDGSTSYLRPMPGAARMYPETDIEPIIPEIKEIELPELIKDKEERIKKEYGLSADLARQIARKGINFDEWAKKYPSINPQFIAEALIVIPKDLRRRLNIEFEDEEKYEEALEKALKKVNEGKLNTKQVTEVLTLMAEKKEIKWEEYEPVSEEEIEKTVKEAIKKNKGAPIGAIMGIVMKELKGRAEGKKVMELIKKQI